MAPENSGEVPDEQEVRLVVLGPRFAYGQRQDRSLAEAEAQKILENRGSVPRRFKNMVVFLAPDPERLKDLEIAVRQWLAWDSIIRDQDVLNLDKLQLRQAEDAVKRARSTADVRIRETYSWLLVPRQEGTGPIQWQSQRITSGDDNIVIRASKKLVANEQLILRWSPALLKMELDRWLWKDEPHIGVKKLWEHLCTYPYLPRLRNESVLLEAIQEGLRGREFFGYAQAIDTSGRYEGLAIGIASASIYFDARSVLMKPELALRQVQEEQQKAPTAEGTDTAPMPPLDTVRERPGPAPPVVLRRFHGSVALEPTRVARDAGRISEEVIQHLTGLLGSKVEVTLEIQAHLPEGAPEHVIRTVTENCKTLKFRSGNFEAE